MLQTEGRMRIAFAITRADSLGGSQVHVLDLASALLARGDEAAVLLGGEGPVIDELRRRSIPFFPVPHLAKRLNPLGDARATLEIWRILRDFRPHLVAAHTAKAGMLARWAAAVAGVPAVFTPHGWAIADRISPRQGRIFKIFEKLAARVSARIINVCEYERRLAMRHGIAPAAKLAVVHNGISDIPDNLRACPGADPPRVLTVARFEEPKDYRTLFAALAQLQADAWTMDLAGDGPLQPVMERTAAQLGIAGRLRFLGARRDVASLLAQAQLFVLSSRSEAFPYTVLEAMRAGLPVVSSDVGGIREAVEEGETGLLVPAQDPTALRGALRRLIVDRQLRHAMGGAARRRYQEHFMIDAMIDKTLQIYREVIAESRTETAAATASRRNQRIEVARYGSK